MRHRIFYFTGSGNSLAMSRAISDRLGEGEVVAMAAHRQGADILNVERIGLVFPTYLWALPRMVAEFARTLRSVPGQYVFAITLCSGTVGRVLYQLRRELRKAGTSLDAGFFAREDEERFWPGRSDDPRTLAMGRLMHRKLPAPARERVDEIARAVQRRDTRRLETTNPFLSIVMGSPMRLVSERMLRTGDRPFASTEACISCGTCARVCPRENVRLENGRPIWHQDCESCYACLLWCPQNAITYRGSSRRTPAHHPDVSLHDMLRRERISRSSEEEGEG